MYNSANVLLGRIKKRYDFTGKQRFVATPLSFSGGVGSGSLPVAGVASYGDALILAKKVYATCEVEREAIKASANDKGAFVKATKETVQKCVESYMRNASRIIFGNGDGSLGVIDTGGVVNADPIFTLTISAASFKEANFEEKDLVNIQAGNGDLFSVDSVSPSTKEVVVTRVTGSQVPADTDVIFMQGSENNDPQGLKGVLDATSGSLYNILVARRWQASQFAAGGAGITPDRMNEVMLEVERKFGRAPNLIVTSYTQYRKLMNEIEDHKRYSLPARDKKLKGQIMFEGLEFMSTRGAIGIFPDRFCEEDRMYFLNDNFIECHHRPGFGWFDDDGTVFLRKSSSDEYEARYGGYYENYITPTAHGVLSGLAV